MEKTEKTIEKVVGGLAVAFYPAFAAWVAYWLYTSEFNDPLKMSFSIAVSWSALAGVFYWAYLSRKGSLTLLIKFNFAVVLTAFFLALYFYDFSMMDLGNYLFEEPVK
jgi:hypothetical protein